MICLGSTGAGPDAFNLQVVSSDETGFTFSLVEASNHSPSHMTEDFHWVAVLKARIPCPTGGTIVAGRADTDSDGSDVTFGEGFESRPVVLTSVMSRNAPGDMVDSDPSQVTTNGFRLSLQGEESVGGVHGLETVGFIAISQGGTAESGAAQLHDGATHSAATFDLGAEFDNAVIIGETQTLNEADNTQVILGKNTTGSQATFNLREETSGDKEVSHTSEELGVATFELGLIPALQKTR